MHIVTWEAIKLQYLTKTNGTNYKNKNTNGEKEGKTIITIIVKNNNESNKNK